MEICRYESQGVIDANNWNDSHKGCDGSFGLFQIGCLHGIERTDLYDPSTNIRMAYKLWSTDGWTPWLNSYKKLLAKI